MAATAAERLGLAPRFGHLDRTRVHVEGRDNRDEEPGEQVVHITRGYSRDHRPDLHHVMVERMGEPQAGIPLLMTPRSGHSRAAQDCGAAVRVHRHQWQTTDGMTSLVADSALYREANRQKLAQTHLKWITRLPATLSPAQAVLAQANPQILASLTAGSRDDEWPSSDGGMAPRWVLIDAELRQAQARRTVDRQWRQQSDQEPKAVKT
jgi:transposase